MELENQLSNASSPYAYSTAPSSPGEYSRNNSMEFYYSAPTSPRRKQQMDDGHISSNLDDFEFETSKKFSGHLQFETSDDQLGQKYRERGDSLPSMAFADELFLNGLVMPLKPPPRLLHYDSDCSSFSQKSPRTVCRIPFARNKSSWNDDFDPFMEALEKVREEKRGRNSHHRRSRSYSPFRFRSMSTKCSSDNSPTEMEPMQVPLPSHSGPLDFKGSAYARWVLDQTRQGMSPENPRGFRFGQRVRPLKPELDQLVCPDGKHPNKKSGSVQASKLQKVKGFLRKYASFGIEKSGNKLRKTSSQVWKRKLSFKFKGENGHTSGKKRMPADTNLAVVEYKPSFALCLGYGAGLESVRLQILAKISIIA